MESKVVPFAELLGEIGRSEGTEGGQTVDRPYRAHRQSWRCRGGKGRALPAAEGRGLKSQKQHWA